MKRVVQTRRFSAAVGYDRRARDIAGVVCSSSGEQNLLIFARWKAKLYSKRVTHTRRIVDAVGYDRGARDSSGMCVCKNVNKFQSLFEWVR